MILDTTTKSVELILGAAVTTNAMPVTVDYVDLTTTTTLAGSSDTQSNGTIAVTIVSAPAASTQRKVNALTVFNADTASKVVTIRLNNNATLRNLISVTLQVGDTIGYSDTGGWYLLDSNGNLKAVQAASATSIATAIHGATDKATPVDADEVGIRDSVTGLLNHVTWANLKATLKAYFDTLYAALAGSATQTFSVAPATASAHAIRAAQYGSQINGWTYANNGTDAVNDIDIAAGSGLDSTRAYFITGTALTKQSDVAWAVGTNAGMLDTGAVGDNDYYIWVIARSDTGVVDYLSSLSNTTPTMPASYDYKRLIGWFKRVGGTIVAFHTYEVEGGGLEMNWDAPTLDVDLVNTLTTARRTDAVKVPLNFSVVANMGVYLYDASAAFSAFIGCPDTTDAAVTVPTVGSIVVPAAGQGFCSDLRIRTSSVGTIAARASLATVDAYNVSTYGFTWARRS